MFLFVYVLNKKMKGTSYSMVNKVKKYNHNCIYFEVKEAFLRNLENGYLRYR